MNNTTYPHTVSRIPTATAGGKEKPSPNDDRSTVKNPNNPQHDKAHGNRGKQKNPNQGTKGK